MRPVRTRARARGEWPAWADLWELRKEMDRLFDSFWEELGLREERRVGVYPPVNLSQDAENFYARFEIPGVDPAELDVRVDGRTLTVAGRRETAAGLENVSWHRRERPSGAFSRSVTLPGDVDAAQVRAEYKNGILTVTLPKAEAVKGRKIQVQVG